MGWLRTAASEPDDPEDADGDGTITVLDAAVCADRCRYASCATSPPSSCGLIGIETLPVLATLGIARRRRGKRARA